MTRVPDVPIYLRREILTMNDQALTSISNHLATTNRHLEDLTKGLAAVEQTLRQVVVSLNTLAKASAQPK